MEDVFEVIFSIIWVFIGLALLYSLFCLLNSSKVKKTDLKKGTFSGTVIKKFTGVSGSGAGSVYKGTGSFQSYYEQDYYIVLESENKERLTLHISSSAFGVIDEQDYLTVNYSSYKKSTPIIDEVLGIEKPNF